MKIISAPWILLCLGCFWVSQLTFADDGDNSVEYKVKAAYLYNFTKFVSWAGDDFQTFNICILGDDPFKDAIDPIEKRSVFGKAIKVFRADNLNVFRMTSYRPHCHILFISSSIDNPLPFKEVANTLTVGESKDFATLGGMIGFINKQDKIKLQINQQAVKRAGLKVSAKLLEVAEIIKEDSND
ncbi:MAG: YfiR family protein [Methylococcaceae bacterium]